MVNHQTTIINTTLINRLILIKTRRVTSINYYSSSSSSTQQHDHPNLIDLDKLKPTRLSNHSSIHQPIHYLDQIKSISKSLNRAFSKNQLINICQSIINNNNNNPLKTIDKKSSKSHLINLILFDHWNLRNPQEIQVDRSFDSLIKQFKSNHQSYRLSKHETFLLYYSSSHLETQPQPHPIIDRLARKNRVKVEISIDQNQFIIVGQMKDRQKFLIDFEKSKPPIHQRLISLDKKMVKFNLNHHCSFLKEISKLTASYLEVLPQENQIDNDRILLVAYSFDQNQLVQRVLNVIDRYLILSNEYQHLPILVDLNLQARSSPDQSQDSKATSSHLSFGFIPFSYPFQLDWPHRLNFQNFARLASSSNISDLDPQTSLSDQPIDHQDNLNRMVSSTFQALNGFSSSSSSVQDWISNSFSPVKDHNEWLECNIYYGHYVKSKDRSSPLLEHSLRLDDSSESDKAQETFKNFWSAKFDISDQSTTQEQFIFLPVSTQYAAMTHSKSPTVKCNDDHRHWPHLQDDIHPVKAPAADEFDDECLTEVYALRDSWNDRSKTSYRVITKIGDCGMGSDGNISQTVHKVSTRRLIILCPHQSTDLMVEIEKIRKIDLHDDKSGPQDGDLAGSVQAKRLSLSGGEAKEELERQETMIKRIEEQEHVSGLVLVRSFQTRKSLPKKSDDQGPLHSRSLLANFAPFVHVVELRHHRLSLPQRLDYIKMFSQRD